MTYDIHQSPEETQRREERLVCAKAKVVEVGNGRGRRHLCALAILVCEREWEGIADHEKGLKEGIEFNNEDMKRTGTRGALPYSISFPRLLNSGPDGRPALIYLVPYIYPSAPISQP